jgi:hypothetical protein
MAGGQICRSHYVAVFVERVRPDPGLVPEGVALASAKIVLAVEHGDRALQLGDDEEPARSGEPRRTRGRAKRSAPKLDRESRVRSIARLLRAPGRSKAPENTVAC